MPRPDNQCMNKIVGHQNTHLAFLSLLQSKKQEQPTSENICLYGLAVFFICQPSAIVFMPRVHDPANNEIARRLVPRLSGT